jgi:hypothetical protein
MNQVIPGNGDTICQGVLHDLGCVPMDAGGPIIELDGFDGAVYNEAARRYILIRLIILIGPYFLVIQGL